MASRLKPIWRAVLATTINRKCSAAVRSLAIQDLRRAIELNPKSAEAYLWLGLALRKTHHNAEAREAFAKSLELNPARVWTKQQLEKTPAQ